MSVIVFACVLGGAFLGMFLRNRLPEQHLSGATKDVVRLGSGLIGTISALVLGLLIASANSTFQTQSTQVQQLTADIILLDSTLAQYGPETMSARNLLRRAAGAMADRIWKENGSGSRKVEPFEANAASTPCSSSQRASVTVVAELRITQPAALRRSTRDFSGNPKWKLTTSGLSSTTTSHISALKGGRVLAGN